MDNIVKVEGIEHLPLEDLFKELNNRVESYVLIYAERDKTTPAVGTSADFSGNVKDLLGLVNYGKIMIEELARQAYFSDIIDDE